MVIIEGSSTAGKTRLAYEVMQSRAPERWLIVPASSAAPKDLAQAGVPIRNAVVWLDEVEHYLADGGLDGAVLDALCPPGTADVLLLATLRSAARNALTSTDLSTSTARAVAEIMRRSRVISLDLALTPAEHERAQLQRADPRIAAALDQSSGAGFAEYLASARAVLERWQSARRGQHPVAGAIISASVDARRVGYQAPIPVALLEELYVHYLDDRIGHRDDQPKFSEALNWASQVVGGASSCLSPLGTGIYSPFVNLVDYAQRTSGLDEVPEAVWPHVLAHAGGADLFQIGVAARSAGQHDISRQAFRAAAKEGHVDAMYNLGVLLQESGQRKETEEWYRRAANAGHVEAMSRLGLLLKEAKPSALRDLLIGNSGRAGLSGVGSQESERQGCLPGIFASRRSTPLQESERWLRRAADAGDAEAIRNLSVLLAETGRVEEAEQWRHRKPDTG
ncbi:hypothetical protein [Nonomuraea jabiensis]|uniref:tetratricopeptide repeat protein n=1 Tax=Nonomuraea jabiensis TaxID=882448 RepID=UPI003D740BAC